jgi:hypothetical protein
MELQWAHEKSAMVPWWKRLIYSLVSAVLGAGVSGAGAAAQQFIANSRGHLHPMGLWTAILFFDPWVIMLSLPGWALAIPIVLLVKNIYGWRFWMYWVIGLCLGPAIILAVALYTGPGLGAIPFGSTSLVYLAAAISGLTTLLYLLRLRRAQATAAVQASAIAAEAEKPVV